MSNDSKCEIPKPKYKVGDIVVIRVMAIGHCRYEQAKIEIARYYDDAKEWVYSLMFPYLPGEENEEIMNRVEESSILYKL